ncbi:hypothetical protein BCR36DRAFT_327894 [Piromyces finnis]|uniref:Chitin-binding type-1 domain-containing protein n=1 Tax=Piromyces finnis TaxID=1754191 RepID=A0A1Y1V880_9FUNG|nr:hypothetical protein BCR36DRAFT_327894 [Piromyces finnis]|eukprot:ORX49639.1 hypothetical protein BCR36DRAFT_327894 [Piromyces finnis]
MKIKNIFLTFTTLLTVTKAYEIKCKEYYSTQKGNICLDVSLKNGVSLYRLRTLNPDIDCKHLKPDTSICIKGSINITKNGICGHGKGSCPYGECCSKEGICGLSTKHCGVGCNPKYGICHKDITSFDANVNQKLKNIKVQNANNTIENSNGNGFETETINDIMEHLNMTKKQAKQFYTYGNKAISYYSDTFKYSVDHKLSLKKCIQMCDKANEKFISLSNNKTNNFNLKTYNKYLKSHNEATTIDDEFLLNTCKSKCYMIKEINENDAAINKNKILKLKRDLDHCDPSSQGKISLVTNNYKNGIPQYKQDNGSAETGIVTVNGCSIPLLQDFYNSDDYGLFVPVCNSHDLCYECQVGKSTCDNRFLNNMKNLCQIYDKWWQYLTDYLTCLGEAELFYAAVNTSFAQDAYDACKIYNSDPNCALCGARVIVKDKLLENPFYVKM